MYQDFTTSIRRLADGASIPLDPANSDYAEYLRWIAAGNQPEPFIPPPALIPTSVTMRQARLALLGAGMLSTVTAALNGIADPTQRAAALIEWEFAATVDRGSPWVRDLAGALRLTPAQLDQLFATAGAM